MLLQHPVIITPRLLPGLRIGGAFISIEYGRDRGHRQHYRYYIDIGDREYTEEDLSTGCQHGLQNALGTLCSFLAACAESRSYVSRTGREGENADLFPDWIGEWAEQYSDELSMLSIELEESPELIEED
jgi:hypothetical protein